jgi:hypothetical protein
MCTGRNNSHVNAPVSIEKYNFYFSDSSIKYKHGNRRAGPANKVLHKTINTNVKPKVVVYLGHFFKT